MNGSIDQMIADLALVVRVADAGGFTAAAKLIGIPQATISRRIALLENKVGVRLFDRNTRSISLTAAGRRAYEHSKLMVQQAEVVAYGLKDLRESLAGDLKIASPVVLGQAYIGDVAACFMEVNPRVEVKLYLTTRDIDIIDEGFDIVFKIGKLPDSGLALTRLPAAKRGLYVTPEYCDTVKHPLELDDLVSHNLLTLGTKLDSSEVIFVRGDEVQNLKLKPRLVCNDVQALKSATLRNLGVGMLPRFSVTNEIADGTLVELLPEWRPRDVEVSAVTPSHLGALPSVTAFLKLTKQRLKESTYW